MGAKIMEIILEAKPGVDLSDIDEGFLVDSVQDTLKDLLKEMGLEDSVEIVYP